MIVKINGLTRSNVSALREVLPEAVEAGHIVLTATTATWMNATSASEALSQVDWVMGQLPTKGHPRASLHAVRRKLAKEAS